MARKTCLYEQHVSAGARLVEFAGWLLPVQFGGVLAEHAHCRGAAALFDTSHMGQFIIRGPAAAEALGRILTRPIPLQPVGADWYCLLLDEQAGILDDVVLMRLGEREFLLVVNAATREQDRAWIRRHIDERGRGADIELVDQSETWGKIDLQGPASAAVLAGMVQTDLARLKYFTALETRIMGRRGILSRSGYTGELGYEIFMPTADLAEVHRVLLRDERVKPAGLGSRDLLRLEMCYGLYGQDYDRRRNPLEADLAKAFSLDHDFVGSARLAELARAGPRQRLVAFASNSRARPEPHSAILDSSGQAVGQVTSGAFSPALGVSIGLGYVEAARAGAGTQLLVDTGKRRLDVTIQDKPLYHRGTCRTRLPLAEART